MFVFFETLLVRLLGWVEAFVSPFLQAVIGWLIDVASWLATTALGFVPSWIWEIVNSTGWQSLVGFTDYVEYYFPIRLFLAFWITVISAIGLIRVFRWIVAIVVGIIP